MPLDWKDFIRIDTQFSPPEKAAQDKIQIEAALDKIFSTVAGQRGLAVLGLRLSKQREKQLRLSTLRGQSHTFFTESSKDGKEVELVNIDPDQIKKIQYLGKDGQYHNYTLEHAIAHELLGHAANAITDEQKATDMANGILGHRGLNQPLRGDYYGSRIVGSPQAHSNDFTPMSPPNLPLPNKNKTPSR